MVRLGYALMGEEHPPDALVDHARRAEEVGFAFAFLSDHYLPWLGAQGNASFAWTVLGAIARETERLEVGTGVTCPTIRYHPAIVAQAAATTATMMPGRFVLGLGSGENLNEHVVGAGWPATDERHAMLEEAIGIIRRLLTGQEVTFRGEFATVEDARLHTLPDEPPPIVVAASGSDAAELAGRAADGLVSLAPSDDLLRTFEKAGGDGARTYGQVTVCWAESEDAAVETVLEHWPQTGLASDENTEFRTPAQFEQAVALVGRDRITERVACGPDPEVHLGMIRRFADAGYEHVYVHQVGPDQEGFFEHYEREILPEFG